MTGEPYPKRAQSPVRERRPRRRLGESDAGRAKRMRRASPHFDQLREYPYCEAARAVAPQVSTWSMCWGSLTVHEPWTRARGGPVDDRRNMVTLCSEHNRQISQDDRMMAWAERHGFLIHADDGPAWLAAGGFKR